MIERKTWAEFKKTGLLLFINQILHVFGWVICYDVENGEIKSVYPARTKFRGFDNKDVSESYIKISEYLKDNADELLKEAKDEV